VLLTPYQGNLSQSSIAIPNRQTVNHRSLALGAKARANAPDLLAGPLANGEALLHGGDHGAGEFGGVIDQRIIAGRHRGIEARVQVSQAAQCTDDAPADVLDHGGNISIGGRFALDKAQLEAHFGPIEVDAVFAIPPGMD
jgi:hypothetical protein